MNSSETSGFALPVLSIHGVPRSGTSWLGQIFNSHPDVAFRFQPLFAYRFKNFIGPDSHPWELNNFLGELYEIKDDEFILQLAQRREGVHQDFTKTAKPSHLVMKMVRYHYLIEKFLDDVEQMKVVGVVRHPCGVINSWLKTPREFDPKWNPIEEWILAPKKNQGRSEEYFGFQKWKEVALKFLALQNKFPNRFYLLRYERLVNQPKEEVEALFKFAALPLDNQVVSFLKNSHSMEIDHPDTVFRKQDVVERWKVQLPTDIRESIIGELMGTKLEVFLDE